MTTHALIGFFPTHSDIENAVFELRKAGFDLRKVSIVGKDEEFISWKDSASKGAKEVGHWASLVGGLFGVLTGAATVFIPGIGQIVVAGSILGLLAGGIEGLIIGDAAGAAVGGMAGAFIGLVEKDSALLCENAIKAGNFALLMIGTTQEQEKAREVLSNAGYNLNKKVTV
ncbi:hypothetical protein BZZ01_00430 [Nostocales cyanobacterium HT-58-2]|nr:hypothetical protein BZZ01_00430 [Nostocales cyanobacterium HT-58-2]